MGKRALFHMRAHFVAYLALFFALGGTSFAAIQALPKDSVGSPQIINGSIQKVDMSRKTVAALRGGRGPRGRTGATGATGAPGATGPAGLQGNQGSPGTPGEAGTARAYGRVEGTTVTISKNVVSVTNPSGGTFCITLAGGIDVTTTGLVVTPDFASDSTAFGINTSQAFAEWDSNRGLGCPAGTMEVETGVRSVSSSGSPDTDVRTITNSNTNQPFFFVVP